MSTNEVLDIEIASEDAVTIASGGKAWRFAHGKIVRGPENDDAPGTFAEERAKIVGILRRVGIFEGTGNDGSWYSQLEADVETTDGVQFVKASLSDPDHPGTIKPSVSTIKFAWGLTQFGKDEQVCITAERSKERVTLPNGRQGGYVTYVNFARLEKKIVKENGVDKIKWVGTPVYSPKRAADAPKNELLDQWKELEPDIRAHPAYADRPVSRDDDAEGNPGTHLSALCQEVKAKGWLTPEEAPDAWLTLTASYFNHDKRASIGAYSDEDWGDVRLSLQPMNELVDAADKLIGKQAQAVKGNASAFAR